MILMQSKYTIIQLTILRQCIIGKSATYKKKQKKKQKTKNSQIEVIAIVTVILR